MQTDLKNRLKALGFTFLTEKAFLKQKRKLTLDNIIEGHWLDPNRRSIYIHQQIFPLGQRYGNRIIQKQVNTRELIKYFGIEHLDINNANLDFVFLDTETTSLGLGNGTQVFLIGFCFFTNDGLVVEQIFLEDPTEELEFLSYLDNQLNKFNIICTFNGKSFDIPILRTRFTLNRLRPEFVHIPHYDLLHVSRQLWAGQYENCKLSELEKQVIQFTRESEEVPGWMIPQLYFDYMKNGDPEPLKGVFYHNECDIVSLAMLFGVVAGILHEPLHVANENPNLLRLAKAYFRKDEWEKSITIAASLHTQSVSTSEKAKCAHLLGTLSKKTGRPDESICWFLNAENSGIFESAEELSKYYEHRKKDYNQALIHAELGSEIAFRQSNTHQINKIRKRIERLKRKLDGQHV